jgi:hypothetical protein
MIRRISTRILASAVALVLLANVASAADPLRVICFVEAQPSPKLEQGYTLGVRLLVTQTQPVAGATVRLYEIVDLFGKKEMFIGTATTDGQGRASLNYLPAKTGSHEIVARFPGMPGYSATEGRTTFQADVAAEPYVVEPAPLASFTSKVPYVVGLVVVAVWALIAYALFGTARGITSGARINNNRKGNPA